jgi:hypothetical protein
MWPTLPLYTLSAVKYCIEAVIHEAHLFTPRQDGESATASQPFLRHGRHSRTRLCPLLVGETERDCVEQLVEGYLGALR